ncbi:hypothetical protein ABZ864_43095 [Streptomyces sp. NPDC047082]|uniref:hypothetical protein n=1 Tax=Streptomyces sp. NPDC047082 TaxID=3155259 RepID=UPI0033C88935
MTHDDSLFDTFWNEFQGRFERLPVWMPGTPMKLGDVGMITSRGWVKETTLDALDIEIKPDDPGVSSEIDYASSGVAGTSGAVTRAGVQAPVAAATGDVTYEFGRAGAFVLRTGETTVHSTADLRGVRQAVLARYQNPSLDWERRWIVVTEVVTARPVLALIASEGGARATLRLRAQAQISPGLTAGAAPSFDLHHWTGLEARLATEDVTVVMWRGHHIVDQILRKPRFDVRGKSEDVGSPGASGTPAFVEVESPDDVG